MAVVPPDGKLVVPLFTAEQYRVDGGDPVRRRNCIEEKEKKYEVFLYLQADDALMKTKESARSGII